ncbi:MAG: ATP-binding protein, partial [Betaproteobacteria bacterium]|nr:ATP-binding protein [Betaproteobacteria bacterium]
MSDHHPDKSASARRAVNAENRQFRMHPHLLYDVIKQQAGSFSKALMEAVQNAIDAGSTQVSVNFDGARFDIEDDGRGFADRRSIEEFFETFGTPHTESSDEAPRYGRFRMGRG